MAAQMEDLEEIKLYIASLKGSSDRARYALYLILVVTILLAVANYNFQPWGWPIRRVEAWYAATPGETSAAFLGGDFQKVEVAREEYLKQLTARSVLSSSPLPGVAIDYNDLGNVGGVALLLLMGVFIACLRREHENVYLSLYKVRRLKVSESAGTPGPGESVANLLYHALAMTQTLSFPPTLARWRHKGWLFDRLIALIYFLPAAVLAWVLHTNIETLHIGQEYGRNMTLELLIQLTLTGLLLLSGVVAWLESRAMAQRWQRAFFAVNPEKQALPSMSLAAWWKLPMGKRLDRPKRVVYALLNEQLEVVASEERRPAGCTVPLDGTGVTKAALREMTAHLLGDWQATGDLELALQENRVTDTSWTVRGTLSRPRLPMRAAP